MNRHNILHLGLELYNALRTKYFAFRPGLRYDFGDLYNLNRNIGNPPYTN